MRVFSKAKPPTALEKGGNGGIIKERNFAERNLAMSLRKPPTYVLTKKEIEFIKQDIRAIGADERIFRFNSGTQTA